MKAIIFSAILGLSLSAQLFATGTVKSVSLDKSLKTSVDMGHNEYALISLDTPAAKDLTAAISEDTGAEEAVCEVRAIFFDAASSTTKVLVAFNIWNTDDDEASCSIQLSGSAVATPKSIELSTVFE